MACINSTKKIHTLIQKFKLSQIAVWFDEAHYGVENWNFKIQQKEENRFFLEDHDIIKSRIFTSASPNREKVLTLKHYFGEIYRPIKISELIKQRWLSFINPNIIDMDGDCEDLNLINLILESFDENNRKWGFSFHNKQPSAFNLFFKHLEKYLKKETEIVPFFLVGDDYKIEPNFISRFNELNEKNKNDINFYLSLIHI